MTTTANVPASIDDPVNNAVLAVSEDRLHQITSALWVLSSFLTMRGNSAVTRLALGWMLAGVLALDWSALVWVRRSTEESGIRAPRGTRNERGMSPFRLKAGNGSAFGSWCHNHRNPRRHRWRCHVLASSRRAICVPSAHVSTGQSMATRYPMRLGNALGRTARGLLAAD